MSDDRFTIKGTCSACGAVVVEIDAHPPEAPRVKAARASARAKIKAHHQAAHGGQSVPVHLTESGPSVAGSGVGS